MKTSIKFFALSLLLSLAALPEAMSQELGKYIDQYEGQAGARKVRVNILRIGVKENEEVLIKISGVDDPISGKIYKYKKEWQSSEKRLNKFIYVTDQIPGKERFATLHSDNYYGSQVFKLFLMDDPMEPIYIYPKDYQEDLDPNFMYAQYEAQQKERAKFESEDN